MTVLYLLIQRALLIARRVPKASVLLVTRVTLSTVPLPRHVHVSISDCRYVYACIERRGLREREREREGGGGREREGERERGYR